jgi:DNA gyrase subunit A
MIPSTPIVISINNEDKVKKIPMETFKPQKRGGKGIKNKDIVKYLIKTNEQDSLICFTQNGRSYQVNVADIPDGVRITDWLELTNDNIVAITNLKNNLDKKYTVFITQQGMVKKTLSSEYQSSRARKSGINAIKLKDNDKIQSVYFMDEEPLMLFSHLGRVIYFETKDIASIGKIAVGVKGINLDADDYVVSSIMIQEDKKLAIFTSDNCGKAVLLTDFYKQNRGGKGILLIPKKEDKTIIKVITINNNDNLIINGDKRTICIAAKDLKESNKDSKGNVLIKDDIIRKVIKV